MIVLADADLYRIMQGALLGDLLNQCQVCAATLLRVLQNYRGMLVALPRSHVSIGTAEIERKLNFLAEPNNLANGLY